MRRGDVGDYPLSSCGIEMESGARGEGKFFLGGGGGGRGVGDQPSFFPERCVKPFCEYF